jgi:hypothetical protein
VAAAAVVVLQDPLFVPQLMAHVGPAALADWMLHVGGLAAFSTFNAAGVHEGLGYCWEWWLQHITLFDWSRVDLPCTWYTWFPEQELLRSVFASLSMETKLTITLYACLPVVPLHAAPPLQQLSKGKVLPEKAKYVVRRTLDAWKYGSGSDFKL